MTQRRLQELLAPVLEASHEADLRREIMRHLCDCLSEPTGKRWQRIYGGLVLTERLAQQGSPVLLIETAHGHHFDLVQKVSFLEHFDSVARGCSDQRAQHCIRKKATELRQLLVPRLKKASAEELPQNAGLGIKDCVSTCSPGGLSSCTTTDASLLCSSQRSVSSTEGMAVPPTGAGLGTGQGPGVGLGLGLGPSSGLGGSCHTLGPNTADSDRGSLCQALEALQEQLRLASGWSSGSSAGTSTSPPTPSSSCTPASPSEASASATTSAEAAEEEAEAEAEAEGEAVTFGSGSGSGSGSRSGVSVGSTGSAGTTGIMRGPATGEQPEQLEQLSALVAEASQDPESRQVIMDHLRRCLCQQEATTAQSGHGHSHSHWRRVHSGLLLVEMLMARGCPLIFTEPTPGVSLDLPKQIWLLEEFEYRANWRAQNLVRKKAIELRERMVPWLLSDELEGEPVPEAHKQIDEAFSTLRTWAESVESQPSLGSGSAVEPTSSSEALSGASDTDLQCEAEAACAGTGAAGDSLELATTSTSKAPGGRAAAASTFCEVDEADTLFFTPLQTPAVRPAKGRPSHLISL